MKTDAEIDAAIYEIDAVMNDVSPGTEVPPFLLEYLVKMRAVIRNLYERPPL
jgi:hypothetical protein